MFGTPATTDFDVQFRILGVPVRINPFFWVMAAILGGELTDGVSFLIWIVCVLVSILVHEFGHALSARAFGSDSSVVLYEFGGLCYSEPRLDGAWKRIIMTAMGPGAGFILLGLLLVVATLTTGSSPLRVLAGDVHAGLSPTTTQAIRFLVFINLFWGIFNLLPILPLDGGWITLELLSLLNPHDGPRRAHIVSLVTAGLAAIFMYRLGSIYNALFLLILALRSYQGLRVLHYERFGGDEDESDWWKR